MDELAAPPPAELGDREVVRLGDELAGRRVALLVCGGIAALRTPLLARTLRRHGAEVTAFVSRQALRFVTLDALAWSTDRPVVERLSPAAEHLGDGARFDLYLLPQATYNTLNKVALGIADGVVTATLASALGRLERGDCSILAVPVMHGTMHNAILRDSLRRLRELGVTIVPPLQAEGKDKMPSDEELLAATVAAVVEMRQRRG